MTPCGDSIPPLPAGGKHGDRDNLEDILAQQLPWIQKYAHLKLSPFLRTKTETGDIVQDALVQFLRHGPRFRISNDSKLRALLARIVENVLHDKYDWFTARRRAVSRERPLPADTVLNLEIAEGEVETPSRIVHKQEKEAWIRLGLELLAPDDRKVLILRDWDNLSYVEIGKQMGISEHAARRKYMSSLKLLIDVVQHLRCRRIDDALQGVSKEP